MEHLFSDSSIAQRLLDKINNHAAKIDQTITIMEVCGTHTMEIGRLGLRGLLPSNVRLISGPGCPVCVTPAGYIDSLCACARSSRVRIATFGDLIRVPGTTDSLAQARASGVPVDVVSGPIGAVELARIYPDTTVIFTSVGFETTIPATARALLTAKEQNITNCKFLVAHRLVPPALDALVNDTDLHISGFLLPGHVSAIIGEIAYAPLNSIGIPSVITGFESLDILGGICSLLSMIAAKSPKVINEYTRIVKKEGNLIALKMIDQVYEPCDAVWRGIGTIPQSGLRIRKEFASFDAGREFNLDVDNDTMPKGCSCGAVLKGIITPNECPLFGKSCNPEHPVGPCMVSSEGSCAAYFKYGG